MKKSIFKKLLVTTLLMVSIISTNCIPAFAGSYNMHYTYGAPSHDTVVSVTNSGFATNTAYVTIAPSSWNVLTVGAYIIGSVPGYSLSSQHVTDTTTKLSYIGSGPISGTPIQMNVSLQNCAASYNIIATGSVRF
jgi:hypothetical protein